MRRISVLRYFRYISSVNNPRDILNMTISTVTNINRFTNQHFISCTVDTPYNSKILEDNFFLFKKKRRRKRLNNFNG